MGMCQGGDFTTVLVESRFTETNLKMKASEARRASTQVKDACPWPTLGPTPTAASSSCAPARPLISMASMLFLARSSRATMSSRRSRVWDPGVANAAQKSRSLTAASSEWCTAINDVIVLALQHRAVGHWGNIVLKGLYIYITDPATDEY